MVAAATARFQRWAIQAGIPLRKNSAVVNGAADLDWLQDRQQQAPAVTPGGDVWQQLCLTFDNKKEAVGRRLGANIGSRITEEHHCHKWWLATVFAC